MNYKALYDNEIQSNKIIYLISNILVLAIFPYYHYFLKYSLGSSLSLLLTGVVILFVPFTLMRYNIATEYIKYIFIGVLTLYVSIVVLLAGAQNISIYLLYFVVLIFSGVYFNEKLLIFTPVVAILSNFILIGLFSDTTFKDIKPSGFISIGIIYFIGVIGMIGISLRYRKLTDKEKEAEKIVNNIKQYINSLDEMISDLKLDMAATSGEVLKSVEQSLASLETKNRTFQQIDQENQSPNNIRQVVRDVSKDSNNCIGIAQTGQNYILTAKESIIKLNEYLMDAQGSIRNISKFITKINDIASLISRMSTRTSLLSLNAEIEAAKVGEKVKGFVLVLDEIKRFADQTQNASNDIIDVVNSSNKDMSRLKKNVEEGEKEVHSETQSIDMVMNQLNNLKPLVDHITLKIDGMEDLFEEMIYKNKKYNEDIKAMNELSKSSSGVVGTITEKNNNHLKKINKISEAAGKLKEMTYIVNGNN